MLAVLHSKGSRFYLHLTLIIASLFNCFFPCERPKCLTTTTLLYSHFIPYTGSLSVS